MLRCDGRWKWVTKTSTGSFTLGAIWRDVVGCHNDTPPEMSPAPILSWLLGGITWKWQTWPPGSLSPCTVINPILLTYLLGHQGNTRLSNWRQRICDYMPWLTVRATHLLSRGSNRFNGKNNCDLLARAFWRCLMILITIRTFPTSWRRRIVHD